MNIKWAIGLMVLALLAGCAGPAKIGEQPVGTPDAAQTAEVTTGLATAQAAPAAQKTVEVIEGQAPVEIAPAIESTKAVEKAGPVTVTEPVKNSGGMQATQAPRVAFESTQTGAESYLPEPFQTWCMFAGTGATMGIDGERLNFTCSQSGEVTVGLFGDVRAGENGWEIARKSFKRSTDGFTGLTSEMTKIEGILLHDGMRCFYAGGAQAFDGKRLTYTCETRQGNEYVLVGDVTLGEEGWLVERGVLVHTAEGSKLEHPASALIDGLGVRK